MLKNKKYGGIDESIIQFNSITGNLEWTISMKYLMQFNWDVNVRKYYFQHYVQSIL